MSSTLLVLGVIATLLVVPGCADPIGHTNPDASPADLDAPASTGKVTTARAADGTFTTTIDATSPTEWVHGDFAAGVEVDATGPWELRFQRTHISTNGGISGTAGVEISPIHGRTFSEVTTAPAAGWISDAADGADTNLDPDYAFEQGDGWYDYDVTTHVLAPRPIVWVIRTGDGTTIKLAITAYYDAAGTSGWFTFTWAPL